MKMKKYGLFVKITEIILFLLFILTAVWTTIGTVYMAEEGYYSKPNYSFYDSAFCDGVTSQYANKIFNEYFTLSRQVNLNAEEKFRLEQYELEFSNDKTNIMFTIIDEKNNVLLSNGDEKDYASFRAFVFIDNTGSASEQYTVNCYVISPLSAADNYSQPYKIFQLLYSMRIIMIGLAVIASLLTITLFILLMCSAGHRKNSRDIVMTWQHKVPFDIYTASLIFAGVLAAKLLTDLSWNWNAFIIIVFVSIVLAAGSAFALMFCMNFAVRVKVGKWWANTVIFRFLRFVFKTFRAILNGLGYLFKRLPMIGKSALLGAGYLFINAILTGILFSSYASAGGVFIWMCFNIGIFVSLCFLLLQMKSVKSAGEKIAAGDYVMKIDTKNLVWDIKQHAENLNNISSGISAAVDERMKSERLKTELITNVSHDIKTPLTSIVNYIDLLKKEPIENETVSEYISVLDRQALRLKKLTEDVLEASKASTGNIPVNFVRTNLVELMNQSVGEYAERFEACQLDIIFQTSQEEAIISADGKLMWRVFDNLMNNICKYSQPNTRVYINIEVCDDLTRITFLNISKYPLNISSDELLERFARGDASRTTEGSGLGLSITKSLLELQKGTFELSVEGDLFKTVMTFATLL